MNAFIATINDGKLQFSKPLLDQFKKFLETNEGRKVRVELIK